MRIAIVPEGAFRFVIERQGSMRVPGVIFSERIRRKTVLGGLTRAYRQAA